MSTENRAGTIDREIQKDLEKGAVPAAFKIASLIEKEKVEKKAASLRYWLENIIIPERYFVSEGPDDQKYYKWKYQYDSLIHGYVKALAQKNYQEEEFYERLWWFIAISSVIEDGEERIPFAFVSLWEDINIPYYCLPEGVRMEEKEFNERWNNLRKERLKLRYASDVAFMQRTEKAGILLELIYNEKDPRDRAVLMADMILYMEDRISVRLQNQLSRKLFDQDSE